MDPAHHRHRGKGDVTDIDAVAIRNLVVSLIPLVNKSKA